MKTTSHFCALIAGVLAIASTGCTVVGTGTIPSAVEGSNQEMSFSADFAYNEDLETITGTATVEDCAVNVNAVANFSTEDFVACVETLNNVESVTTYLNDALANCLQVDEINLDEEQVGIIYGRYELTDSCKKGKKLGHTKGKGHTSHGKGKGKGHEKGKHNHNGNGNGGGDGEVIGTGCIVGIYIDCEVEGCVGDGLAVALIDDNDPDNIFYSNCGILNSGDITVDFEGDTGGGGVSVITPLE